MATIDKNPVIGPGQGMAIQGPTGLPMLVKAGEGLTNGSYTLVEYAHEPHAPGPPPHIHHEHEEAFYVLEGELTLRMGDDYLTLPAGSFACVPRGTVHQPSNRGAARTRFIFIVSPAGMEHWFQEFADLLRHSSDGVDHAALDAIDAKYDVEFVDPQPAHVTFPRG